MYCGQRVVTRMAISPTPIKGMASLTVSPNVEWAILVETKIPTAKGGVRKPTHILTSMMAPKWTVLMP